MENAILNHKTQVCGITTEGTGLSPITSIQMTNLRYRGAAYSASDSTSSKETRQLVYRGVVYRVPSSSRKKINFDGVYRGIKFNKLTSV